VLTQPDRKAGRGGKLSSSPVKDLAIENKIKVLQPSSLKGEGVEEELKELQPDLMLVVAYGLLIPRNILDIPGLGCLNVHASLLPKWRGASPMENSINSGDSETGMTMMRMSEGLDEGPMLKQFIYKLNKKETLGSLEKEFMKISSLRLEGFLKDFEDGRCAESNQPESGHSYANKIDSYFKQINWPEGTAIEIERRIRALNPKHGAFTYLGKNRIKILSSSVLKNVNLLKPGSIDITNNKILVSCKDNTCLDIELIQMAGKKIVDANEFLRGYKKTLKDEGKFSYLKV
jgi:methionyl-tRNA formyltransferase